MVTWSATHIIILSFPIFPQAKPPHADSLRPMPVVTRSAIYILPFPIFPPCQIARCQVVLIVTLSAISPGDAEKLTKSKEPERFLHRDFSSVSSRWYLCARESPCALHPVSGKVPHPRDYLRCKDEKWSCIVSQTNIGTVSDANLNLWNSSNVRVADDGPFSSFQGRPSSTFSSFPLLSPPRGR